MKVYSYTFCYDKIKEEGYKSLALFDKESETYKNKLWTHRYSAKTDDFDDILVYMELIWISWFEWILMLYLVSCCF